VTATSVAGQLFGLRGSVGGLARQARGANVSDDSAIDATVRPVPGETRAARHFAARHVFPLHAGFLVNIISVGLPGRAALRGAARFGFFVSSCLAMLDGVALAQRFDNWTAAPSLPGVVMSNMATDPVTGAPTLIMNTSTTNDTLVWNGAAFVSAGLAGTPGVLQGEALAPFSVGGTSGLVHLDGNGVTSVWTGGASWTTLGVLSPSPSPRTFAAVASVPGAGGEAFLCGGGTAGGFAADLWSFNGSVWTDRTPFSGPRPAGRLGASLTVNGTGGLLLFAGQTGPTTVAGDLWEFSNAAWQLAGKGPARAFHTSMLDISRGVLLVAGGFGPTALTNDMWSLPLPRTGVVSVIDWTQITAALPFVAASPLVTGALDSVRNEPVLADAVGIEVVHDKVASFLVRGTSPVTACVVPNLQLVGFTVVEPRVGTSTVTVPMGGLTGAAGAPMVLGAEFAIPGIGLPGVTPIPGTSCLSFLSPAAITIAGTATGLGGQYQFNFLIPPNPVFVGTVVDLQAFGLFGALIGASDAARMVIGQN